LAQVPTKINVAGPHNNPVHTKCKYIFVRSQKRQEEVLDNRDFLEQCE